MMTSNPERGGKKMTEETVTETKQASEVITTTLGIGKGIVKSNI